jgi:tetratricopeptide (TPR) repeat protein
MKRCTGIFIWVFIALQVTAQQNKFDILRQLLATTKKDTVKVNLLNQISLNFSEINPDSTLFYGNQALDLSKKIHYKEGEIFALLNTSFGFALSGNYSRALENSLEALKKSEAINKYQLLANSYFNISLVYSIQEDHRMSIPYGLKALEIYKKIRDSLNIANELINIGVSYRELNEMDSARYYFNQSLELSLKLKKIDNTSAIYLNLGIISLKMKQYDLGISYCRLATPYYKAANNPLFLSSIYNVLGDLFDSTGRRDSAFFYSRLALHYAREMGSPQLLLFSTKQLSALFKESNKLDSAFVYHELAMNAKDSLTSQEKQRQVQALTFNEQMRQIEIAKQKNEEAAARKRNLELAGIAIFIPLFLFVVLLLGRKKVKSRTIEFLGILGLLFLFEFIVLLAHPYIGQWTHESPLWMLLILVAVAAILIPLHHRSEAWIKKKLASKPEVKLQPETL